MVHGSPVLQATVISTTDNNAWNIQGALKLLLWSFFSSGTIFLNKRLYTEGGFPYPLASTAVGQLATSLGGYLLIVLGIFPRKPLPHPSQALSKLVPAALATSGTLFAGNYAYLSLSIAFMQVLPTTSCCLCGTSSQLCSLL
jgi:drug/metabolite transporter (DMT)-like permease